MTFHLTTIPSDYPYGGSLAFDKTSMATLFAYGQACAEQGAVWVNAQQAIARFDQAARPRTDTSANTSCPLLSSGALR
jgi:hypothetical protein